MVFKHALNLERGLILGTFRLLTLELLGPEIQLVSYFKIVQNILMTFLASSQMSDRCPLGFLFLLAFSGVNTRIINVLNTCVLLMNFEKC